MGFIVRNLDAGDSIMKHGLKPDTHVELSVSKNSLRNERIRGLEAFLGVHAEEKVDSICNSESSLCAEEHRQRVLEGQQEHLQSSCEGRSRKHSAHDENG